MLPSAITKNFKHIDVAKTGIISIYKGDVASFDLQINEGTILDPIIYKLEGDDILKLFVLYPNSDLDSSIIYKEYTKDDLNEDNSITIKLDSYDTQYLNEGLYYYTIKLYKGSEDVVTIQKRTKFILIN